MGFVPIVGMMARRRLFAPSEPPAVAGGPVLGEKPSTGKYEAL